MATDRADRYEIAVLGLAFTGRHGVFEEERREGRLFEVDVICEVDRVAGFTSDRLEDTLDYRRIADAVLEIGAGPSCTLVEHLAERMAKRCLALPHVRAVDLTIRKRATEVPGNPRWVAVSLHKVAATGSNAPNENAS